MTTGIYRSEAGRELIAQHYAQLLQRWPVPNRQYHVPTSQGPTFVIDSGPVERPAVLMLHGSVSNSFAWLGDVERLSRDRRVICVDLIGEAGFSSASRPAYGSGDYAEWLSEVTDALKLTRFSLVGLSLGGWMALDFATRHPGRVEQLCLLCPGGLAKANGSFLIKTLFYMMFGDWGKHRINVMLNGGELPDDPGMHEAMAFMNLLFAHFKPRRGDLPIFSDQQLHRLDMPVLVIFGLKDVLLPPRKSAARLEALAPVVPVQTVLLADTGHVVVNQAERIAAFLDAAATTA